MAFGCRRCLPDMGRPVRTGQREVYKFTSAVRPQNRDSTQVHGDMGQGSPEPPKEMPFKATSPCPLPDSQICQQPSPSPKPILSLSR
jgi:hypothetical protein